MEIDKLLRKRKVGPAEAARQIGISRQALWLVRAGVPSGRKVAKKIVAWSDGKISEAAVLMGEASK